MSIGTPTHPNERTYRPMDDRAPPRARVSRGSVFDLRLEARIGAVPVARHGLNRWLRTVGVGEEQRDEFAMVVTEMVANAVEASPTPTSEIEVIARRDADQVVLVVSDQGWGFQLDGRPELPPAAALRGRGLPIIDALTDRIDVYRADGRTRVEVTRAVGR
jgi:anti-sigma regulatory factor (Ser/Thr protein kinase)